MLTALGMVLRCCGYRRMTVEDIIEVARISRRTFYDHFAGKADAFCVAHAEATALMGERVRAACDSERNWPEKVGAAVVAALDWVAQDPNRANLVVAEPLTAGPEMGYAYDRLVARFEPGLEVGRAFSAAELPNCLEEGLLAGFACVISTHLRSGTVGSLPSQAPSLASYLLTPYLSAMPLPRSLEGDSLR